jgi:hypothetical protein
MDQKMSLPFCVPIISLTAIIFLFISCAGKTPPVPQEIQASPQPEQVKFVPAIPYADRFNDNIELSKSKKQQLIKNGDFENGLDGWIKGNALDRMNSTMTANVVYDEDIQSNVAEFTRADGGFDGSSIGVYQDVFINLSKYKKLQLKLDAKPVFQSLTGGGWAGGAEYPVTMQVCYIDQRGEPQTWSHGFYFRDVSQYDDSTKVDENAWYTYTTPDLKKIKPDCADKKLVSEGIAWGRKIHKYNPPVIPKYIVRILVYGSGWDFTGRVDNVELIMAPRRGGCLFWR